MRHTLTRRWPDSRYARVTSCTRPGRRVCRLQRHRSFYCAHPHIMKRSVMQDIDQLSAKTVDEIEKMLSTKTVVGDPITVNDSTLIPLISVGFGFGAATSVTQDPKKGSGGGTGGGGGVKPVALVVVDANGVRVDAVKSGTASVLDRAIDTIGAAVKERTSSSSG